MGLAVEGARGYGAGLQASFEKRIRLWEWDGAGGRAGLRETRKFDRELKPEGVTRASAGGRDFLLVVFDSGGYSATD